MKPNELRDSLQKVLYETRNEPLIGAPYRKIDKILDTIIAALPRVRAKNVDSMEHPEWYKYADKERHSTYELDLAHDDAVVSLIDLLQSAKSNKEQE